MHCYDHCVVLAFLLHFMKAELILVRKQDEVYCMESNSSNKALTWIPTIERDTKFIYKEEVIRMPTNENDREEFRHLNCDLMRDGGCPLADIQTESWEIIDHASDEYGFISDHRWHALPMYNTSGKGREMQEIPITIGVQGQILMSILAKNNAVIAATDGENGYIIIKLDAYLNSMDGKRRSLSYCPKDINKDCSEKEIISQIGSTLNDGTGWENIKIIIKPKMERLLITINNTENEVFWNVPTLNNGVSNGFGQVKKFFITTTNQQMGFWKFHDYRVLRQKQSGNALTLDFETSNNSQLCLSILYHSGGLTGPVPNAATLTITPNTSTFEQNLQAGEKWQEYRQVFNVETNTKYQLSLKPLKLYSNFAIGEIRVCQEREYFVTKMKVNNETINITCAILNENKTISEPKLEDDIQFNSFIYACPKGSFGKNCNIPCSEFGSENCKGLRVYNTKVYSCLPGYNGTNCDDECQGNYGPSCRNPCHHCRNQAQCDFVSGACPNADCEDGYMPGLCEDECLNGTYGRNCIQNCSDFCPIANQCSHIDGSCTKDNCLVEIYEPPTCQYPRIMLNESPQLIKSGIDHLNLSIPSECIPEENHHLVHQIGIQYRLHDQSTSARWREGVKMPFSVEMGEIMLSSLTSKTTYDVRAILYDDRGYGNNGDEVPVLFDVTTLCRPAGKSGLQVKPEGKTIKVEINTMGKNEECDASSDYLISIRGTGKYIILSKDLTGHSAQLQYETMYTVDITASDIVQTIDVMTEKEPSIFKFIIGGLLLLIFVLLVFILIFWCNNNRKLKKRNPEVLSQVKELVYEEIDLRKPVALPRWKLPQRVVGEPHGYLGVMEPYQYDVVREPQPLWPWMKRFARRSVDQEGYLNPVALTNVAESSM